MVLCFFFGIFSTPFVFFVVSIVFGSGEIEMMETQR